MNRWPRLPFDTTAYHTPPDTLRERWPRLHASDAEPWPEDAAVQAAWAHYHSGQLEAAWQAGMAAQAPGWIVACQAELLRAIYLEEREAIRQALLQRVAMRCHQLIARDPADASAHALLGQALLQCGQSICLARHQQHELGLQVRLALTTALRLRPANAQAHIALAVHYTNILDRQGHLLAKLEGADGAGVLQLLQQALVLHPGSVLARLEKARALLVLDGARRQAEADALLEDAARQTCADAAERLDVERARAELAAD